MLGSIGKALGTRNTIGVMSPLSGASFFAQGPGGTQGLLATKLAEKRLRERRDARRQSRKPRMVSK